MITHELKQGSPAWLAHRRNFRNASDAPAMMGCSSHKTRTQLMQEMHTGIAPEVDAATQRRFDDGHLFEALCRPLAVETIGEAVFPVTGTKGTLGASFDGLTMGEDVAFEHKTLNEELRAAMVEGCTGADLPLAYRVQMEQQCIVSGCERVLFMATRWKGEECIERRECWYTPDPALAAAIVDGWAQFDADLAVYVPAQAAAPVMAAQVESLPAVSVRMDGAIAVISNLDVFGSKLREFVANIDMKPSTDQAFANAEAAVKTLEKAQNALEQAETAALAQMEPVEAMRRAVADYVELARTTRLMLEKVVKIRKEQIRVEIVQAGQQALAEHVAGLNQRIGKAYLPVIQADFGAAIKGKRTVDSLRDAVNTTLANAKISASAIADKIQINMATLRELAGAHTFLFADTGQLVQKAPDDLRAVVVSRIAEHDKAEAARLEAQRETIRQQEREKLERERTVELKRQQDAIDAQARASAQAVIAQAATPALAPAPAPVAAPAPAPVAAHAAAAPRQAGPEVDPGATVNISQINAILASAGVSTSAGGLALLGFEALPAKGAAKLYRETDLPRMVAAMREHLAHALEAQAA